MKARQTKSSDIQTGATQEAQLNAQKHKRSVRQSWDHFVFFEGNLLVLSFKSLEDFSVELKEVRVVDLFWNNTFNIHISLDLIHKFDYLGIIMYT